MTTALAIALRKAAEMQGRRTRNVVLPLLAVHGGVGRRAAAEAPVTLRPISVLRPEQDTAQTVHEFVLEQFPAPARKLAR